MIKYKLIIASILIFFLIILCIIIWHSSLLFENLATLLPKAERDSEIELNATTNHKKTITLSALPLITNGSNSDQLETIEQTIARIKRDVIVTGTITGISGEESAIIQIKNMTDRSFRINTHLMDGFIIVNITPNHIILKNQRDKSFFMSVQSTSPAKSRIPDSLNSFGPPITNPSVYGPGGSGFMSKSRSDELKPIESDLVNSFGSPITNPSMHGPGGSGFMSESRSDKLKPIKSDSVNTLNPPTTNTFITNSPIINPSKYAPGGSAFIP